MDLVRGKRRRNRKTNTSVVIHILIFIAYVSTHNLYHHQSLKRIKMERLDKMNNYILSFHNFHVSPTDSKVSNNYYH